jgi:hypothetical protein
MRVNIGRGAHVGMPKELLRQLEVSSFGVDQGRRRMPEGVKALGALRPRDVQSIESRIKHVLTKNIRI